MTFGEYYACNRRIDDSTWLNVWTAWNGGKKKRLQMLTAGSCLKNFRDNKVAWFDGLIVMIFADETE